MLLLKLTAQLTESSRHTLKITNPSIVNIRTRVVEGVNNTALSGTPVSIDLLKGDATGVSPITATILGTNSSNMAVSNTINNDTLDVVIGNAATNIVGKRIIIEGLDSGGAVIATINEPVFLSTAAGPSGANPTPIRSAVTSDAAVAVYNAAEAALRDFSAKDLQFEVELLYYSGLSTTPKLFRMPNLKESQMSFAGEVLRLLQSDKVHVKQDLTVTTEKINRVESDALDFFAALSRNPSFKAQQIPAGIVLGNGLVHEKEIAELRLRCNAFTLVIYDVEFRKTINLSGGSNSREGNNYAITFGIDSSEEQLSRSIFFTN